MLQVNLGIITFCIKTDIWFSKSYMIIMYPIQSVKYTDELIKKISANNQYGINILNKTYTKTQRN